MPAPTREHDWLKQFAGDWATEAECFMEPGKPPTKARGAESARMLGGFWLLADGKSDSAEMPFAYRLTLGFDPEKRKYIGTWVDSMTSYLWRYEGSVDPSGRILTLETTGYCPTQPGKLVQFREVTEFKDSAHRRFTSTMQNADGTWTTLLTVNYRRTGSAASQGNT
jgi:hypothetical protein